MDYRSRKPSNKSSHRNHLSLVNSATPNNPLEIYLSTLAPSGRRSMRSLLTRAAAILKMKGSLEKMPWHKLRYHHLITVRAFLMDTQKTPNTVNTTLAAMRGILNTSFNMGLLSAEDYLRIRNVKRVRGQRLPAGRCLTQAEVKALLRACKRDKSANGTRDGALIALMLAGGLRRSEVVSVQLDDYAPRRGLVHISEGKGNKQRSVFLPRGTKLAIERWLKVRGEENGPLFCGVIRGYPRPERPLTPQRVYALLESRAKEAKIQTISPHDLRRTFITRLLDNDVDINTVRQLVGHQDIQTTAGYDRRDVRNQRRAVKVLDRFE